MKKKLTILFFSALVLLNLALVSASAVTITSPIQSRTFEDLINRIINVLFNVALIALPLMFVIAGFFFLLAEGEPAKIEQAKNLIKYTLIGFFIILLAKGFIEFFKQALQ